MNKIKNGNNLTKAQKIDFMVIEIEQWFKAKEIFLWDDRLETLDKLVDGESFQRENFLDYFAHNSNGTIIPDANIITLAARSMLKQRKKKKKVILDLTDVIEQAVLQVNGSDEREMLRNWVRRNHWERQFVAVRI